jgi:hypothetical protein
LIGVDVGSNDALVANSEKMHINFVRCGTAAALGTDDANYLSFINLPSSRWSGIRTTFPVGNQHVKHQRSSNEERKRLGSRI